MRSCSRRHASRTAISAGSFALRSASTRAASACRASISCRASWDVRDETTSASSSRRVETWSGGRPLDLLERLDAGAQNECEPTAMGGPNDARAWRDRGASLIEAVVTRNHTQRRQERKNLVHAIQIGHVDARRTALDGRGVGLGECCVDCARVLADRFDRRDERLEMWCRLPAKRFERRTFLGLGDGDARSDLRNLGLDCRDPRDGLGVRAGHLGKTPVDGCASKACAFGRALGGVDVVIIGAVFDQTGDACLRVRLDARRELGIGASRRCGIGGSPLGTLRAGELTAKPGNVRAQRNERAR